jgi:hypothetical protein
MTKSENEKFIEKIPHSIEATKVLTGLNGRKAKGAYLEESVLRVVLDGGIAVSLLLVLLDAEIPSVAENRDPKRSSRASINTKVQIARDFNPLTKQKPTFRSNNGEGRSKSRARWRGHR